MQFIKRNWRAEVLLLIILVAIGWWQFSARKNTQTISIDPQDSISSWSFTGADTGNDVNTAKTNADITKLTALIGTGKYPDYDIYVAMAQDYDFLGDGKNEYQSLEKAIAADPTRGVAWDNIGVLMEKLGALNTARDAYAKAVAIQPTVGMFQEAQLQFLTAHFPQDTVAIENAFDSGMKASADANLFPIEAAWLTSTGSTTAAISAWKEFSTHIPANSPQQAAINQKIAQLRAK
jgi:tetratricopeptide (TPR) repeat protein